jgi:hypothetical protein
MEAKLRVFSFKILFVSQIKDLRTNLDIVNDASKEVGLVYTPFVFVCSSYVYEVDQDILHGTSERSLTFQCIIGLSCT